MSSVLGILGQMGFPPFAPTSLSVLWCVNSRHVLNTAVGSCTERLNGMNLLPEEALVLKINGTKNKNTRFSYFL